MLVVKLCLLPLTGDDVWHVVCDFLFVLVCRSVALDFNLMLLTKYPTVAYNWNSILQRSAHDAFFRCLSLVENEEVSDAFIHTIPSQTGFIISPETLSTGRVTVTVECLDIPYEIMQDLLRNTHVIIDEDRRISCQRNKLEQERWSYMRGRPSIYIDR